MGSLTDDDKTQLSQLTDYLLTRQVTIVDRWMTKCSLNEVLQPVINPSNEVFKDQLLRLLQGIVGWHSVRNLDEKLDQQDLHSWQGDYSRAEWVAIVDSFYAVFDEEIQQFLALYPQMQPRLLPLVYSQLRWLFNEVNRDSLIQIETSSDEQIQLLRAALDNLQQLTEQRFTHLQQVVHDLRGNYGILSSAASLLQRPLKAEDRKTYMDMLNRNVIVAQQLLDQLITYAQPEVGGFPNRTL